ncbi:MAG TPA: VWA domain-containing protein [Planctomycetota bacterium]|nr:VWA domain-containing protein [Planctomycetota bacterium]
MTPKTFELHNPWLLLLALPALGLLLWRWRRRGGSAAILFPSVARIKDLAPTFRQRARRVVPILQAAAVLGLVVAAARPREGDARTLVRRQGVAIQMVLDRSSSMEDVMTYAGAKRRRIDIVKEVFSLFVAGGKGLSGRKTDLIGLTTFARFTDERCPLISLQAPLLTAVQNLETVEPALDQYDQPVRDVKRAQAKRIPLKPNPLNATAIGDGLQRGILSLVTAEEALSRGGEESVYKIKGKAIILLTDSENNTGDIDPVEAGKYAAANGIRIYYVVFRDPFEEQETIFGRRIVRELSEDELLAEPRRVTQENVEGEKPNGKAFLARSGEELVEIYKEIDRLERSEIGHLEFKSYEERYRWFLVPAIACIILAAFLGETVFRGIP